MTTGSCAATNGLRGRLPRGAGPDSRQITPNLGRLDAAGRSGGRGTSNSRLALLEAGNSDLTSLGWCHAVTPRAPMLRGGILPAVCPQGGPPHAAGRRDTARTVRGPAPDRRRGDGRGLQGARHPPRPRGCPQGPPVRRPDPRAPSPLPAGGPRHLRAQPSAHLRPARHRVPRRHGLPGDGVRRGAAAVLAHRSRTGCRSPRSCRSRSS